MKLIDILVDRLPVLGGWPIDSDDERTLTSSLPEVSWGMNGGGYYAFLGPNDSVNYQQYENAILASKTEWDGEGMPPEGCVCEVKGCIGHYLQWHKVTVFAVRGKTVFFDADDGRWGQTDSHEFRPFSPEVERKRAEGVIALSRVDKLAAPFEYGDKFSDGQLICSFFYELYDAIAAGKIPGIRID